MLSVNKSPAARFPAPLLIPLCCLRGAKELASVYSCWVEDPPEAGRSCWSWVPLRTSCQTAKATAWPRQVSADQSLILPSTLTARAVRRGLKRPASQQCVTAHLSPGPAWGGLSRKC